MLDLRDEDLRGVFHQRGEVPAAAENVCDPELLEVLDEVRVGDGIHLREAQRDLREGGVLVVLGVGEQAQHLGVRRELRGRHALLRQEEPHGTAVAQRQRDGFEVLAGVIGEALDEVHHVDVLVSGGDVERLLVSGFLVEYLGPGGFVVDGGDEGEDRRGVQLQARGLVFQKVVGLFVDPALERLVHLLRAGLPGKGIRVMLFG